MPAPTPADGDLDRIELCGLRCAGHHGADAAERAQAQLVVVDVTVHADLARAAVTDELADTVDAPRPTADADASAGDGRLQRERPEFAAVAENTEVDTIPYENAAAFLANTLYAVPPANTRFEWVGAETDAVDPTPDWDLDVDW